MKGKTTLIPAVLVLLTGFAPPARAQAILSPDKLLFHCVAGQCPPETTTLTNVGNKTVNITIVVLSGRGFLFTNNCALALRPGESCQFSVSVSASPGTYNGVLSVTDSAPNSPQQAVLKALVKQAL